MTIQESIIQALQASHEAHQSGLVALRASQVAHQQALADIAQLQAEKFALEAKISELKTEVAGLAAKVAHHEAESVKIVEPDQVNPLLDWLSRAVSAIHSAIAPNTPPKAAAVEPPPSEASHTEARHAETSAPETIPTVSSAAEAVLADRAPAPSVEPLTELHHSEAQHTERHRTEAPLDHPVSFASTEVPSLETPAEPLEPLDAAEGEREAPVTAHSMPRTIILDTLSADPEPAETALLEEQTSQAVTSHSHEAIGHALDEAEAKLEHGHSHGSASDDKHA